MDNTAHSEPTEETRELRFFEVEGQERVKLPKLTRAQPLWAGTDTEPRNDDGEEEEDLVDEEDRTIDLSFSSEYPVERWFGNEVLSHNSGSADLSRLNDSAQVLFNHNMDDVIGVVQPGTARIDPKTKRGMATVRLAKTPRGEEIRSLVNDGILKNVSFGYRINQMDVEDAKSDTPTYRATDWSPYEISLVSVPADPSIGVGRSDPAEECDVIVRRNHQPAAAAATAQEVKTMTQAQAAAPEAVDIKVVRAEAVEAERARIASINALGDKFGAKELARQLVDGGRSLDEARAAFLDRVADGKKPVAEGAADLPLTEKEKRSYSLVRAINAAVNKDWKNAGFEREISEAIAKRAGRDTAGFFMPMNVRTDASSSAYAIGTAGSGTSGGTLVATNLLAGEFIEVLRNKTMVVQAGARMLSGLVGNVDIPRQTSQTQTYWVGEKNGVTENEAAFDKITLSPKNIGTKGMVTRQMLLQSTPDIEMVVRNDLAAVLALGIDLAAISGSGSSNQPKGILNQSGLNTVDLAGNAIHIDSLVDLETYVMAANADLGAMAYLANARTVGQLKKLRSTTGTYLWNGALQGATAGTPGEINGYPVLRTNQVPANLAADSKTNLSAMLFGSFNQLLIGEWGTLEILPNPYGAGYDSGAVELRALQTIDIAVRHVEAFAAALNIDTTVAPAAGY
jgi:HK97 family phage major capsid protein/HK97 family phage prohead protease